MIDSIQRLVLSLMVVRPFRSLSMSVYPIIYVESITFNHLIIYSFNQILTLSCPASEAQLRAVTSSVTKNLNTSMFWLTTHLRMDPSQEKNCSHASVLTKSTAANLQGSPLAWIHGFLSTDILYGGQFRAYMWCIYEHGSDLWTPVLPSQSTGKELGNVICGCSGCGNQQENRSRSPVDSTLAKVRRISMADPSVLLRTVSTKRGQGIGSE